MVPDTIHYYLIKGPWGVGIFEFTKELKNALYLMRNINTGRFLCLSPFDFNQKPTKGNDITITSLEKAEYQANLGVYSLEFTAAMIFNKRRTGDDNASSGK